MKTIWFLLFLFIGSWSFAGPEDLTAQFNSQFKEILVDVRGSRGGNGDVAGGYLTVMDLLINRGVSGGITVLVDDTAAKILDRLAHGNEKFWSSVKVTTLDKIPQGQTFDLYLAMASPSGTFRYKKQLTERVEKTTEVEVSANRINISKNGVLIVQTVLGNTENPRSLNYQAVVRHEGINYDMSPAGIGEKEAGIYNDFVAVSLRDRTAEEVRDFVFSELGTVDEGFSREAIRTVLQGRNLRGSQFGLAYGISSKLTQPQFLSYLRGLSTTNGESYCIVTPSAFSYDALSVDLRSKVKILSKGDIFPEIAEPGVIYIVKTATLPHSVFVGLLAYSMKAGLVPVGAGDGFMSAAINLGGRFVLTRVAWNARNLTNLWKRLSGAVVKRHDRIAKILMDVFGVFKTPDLREAQELDGELFKNLGGAVADLAERIMNAAVRVRSGYGLTGSSIEAHAETILDPILRTSFMQGGLLGEMRSAAEMASMAQALESLSMSLPEMFENFKKLKHQKWLMKEDKERVDKWDLLMKKYPVYTFDYSNSFKVIEEKAYYKNEIFKDYFKEKNFITIDENPPPTKFDKEKFIQEILMLSKDTKFKALFTDGSGQEFKHKIELTDGSDCETSLNLGQRSNDKEM